MANPFADDDDNEGSAANQAAVEKIKEATDDGDEEIKITLPEEGDEDDEAPATTVQDKISREEKRRDRARAHKERLAATERRAQDLEDENRRLRQQPPPQYAQPQHQGPDPIDLELKRVYDAQNELFQNYNNAHSAARGALTKETVDDYDQKARQLEERKSELLYVKNQRKHGGGVQAIAEEVNKAQLRQKYADVYSYTKDGRQPAVMYAQGLWAQRVARGEVDGEELYESVMNEARKEFRLPGYKPKPNESERQRYSGTSRGAGGSISGERRQTITMTADFRKMAQAAYPKMEPAAAMQKWANGPGRKLAESQKGTR